MPDAARRLQNSGDMRCLAHPHRSPLSGLSLLLLALGLFAASPAQAVPSFARKYQTSCQTCHGVPPKLNPFGTAFRRNGYRFPEGGEETMRKEEPVPLGQPANADLFPAAVWPGDLPVVSTMSIIMQGGFVVSEAREPVHVHGAVPAVTPADETHAHGADEGGWGGQFGLAEAALVWGGTLGETLAYFGKVAFATGAHAGTMVERPHVVWTPLGATLGVRMGLFDPGLTPSLSMHRNTLGHNLRFTTAALGDNGWAPEPEQMGVESFGTVVDGRLGYTAGVVEGSGNLPNRAKDFYGRVEYKIGGMRLDGVGGTTESLPWHEWSVTVGVFGYQGFATLADPAGGVERQSDLFRRLGGDVSCMLGDAHLMLAGFRQADERPVFGSRERGNLLGGVAQLEYVVWPWLVPAVRYEVFRQDLPGDAGALGHHLTVGLDILARANVYVRLLARAKAERHATPAAEDFTLNAGWAL